MSRVPKVWGWRMWWPDSGASSWVIGRKTLGLSLETSLALGMTNIPALHGTEGIPRT